MTETTDPLLVAMAVATALDGLGVRYTIGGSIASSFAGEPRSTVDIDMVAAVTEPDVAALVTALSRDFYIDAHALRRAIRAKSSVNLIHQATMIKVDLFIAGGTPLDEQQIARRRTVALRDDVTLPLHPPEDILLQKLRWYRLGGEKSDRQWRDILGIVRVQGSRLDTAYLRQNAPILGVSDLLEKALESELGA